MSCFPLAHYNISCKIRSQCIVDNYDDDDENVDDDDDDEQRVERVCCLSLLLLLSVSAGVAIRIAADTVAAVSHLLSICVLVFIPVTRRELGYAGQF